ncbi:MAG: hypothetical protein ACOX5Q_05780 [Bacillota bacterium]|jgi:hypothetical protein
MTLREAIIQVLGHCSLTYREITERINASRLYMPRDGMLVPEAQVRPTIRENARSFTVDRSTLPNKVSILRPTHTL